MDKYNKFWINWLISALITLLILELPIIILLYRISCKL
jgi:hypothetical protein